MEKVVIGIDVAKDKLDVAVLQAGEWIKRVQVPNTASGHARLVRMARRFEWVHVVLEATGSYHSRLVTALLDAAVPVSVVNPLVIKRYAQMKLRRIKTDRSDAMLLAEYGTEINPGLYRLPPQGVRPLRQLQAQVDLFIKHRTALVNQLHALETLPDALASCRRILRQAIRQLDAHLKKLELEQQRIIDRAFAKERALLESIAGIGPRTSTVLLTTVGDLSQFDNHNQLAAFVGLNPKPVQSGTSLRPRAHISKQGHARMRTAFYMAAWSASAHNPACRALYERLLGRGKPKRVALIAVANKLLKQAFAIVKSGAPYDPNYQQQLAIE